jgi:translation initiation factor IF-2
MREVGDGKERMMQTSGDRVTGGGKAGAGDSAQLGKAMRLYELAKELGVENKDMVARARVLGIEVKNHMSALEPDDVARMRRSYEKERAESTVTERLNSTVLRRRSRAGVGAEPVRGGASPAASSSPAGGEGEEGEEAAPKLSREEIRRRAAEEAAQTRAELAAAEARAKAEAEARARAEAEARARAAEAEARARAEAEARARAAEAEARARAAEAAEPTAAPAPTAPDRERDEEQARPPLAVEAERDERAAASAEQAAAAAGPASGTPARPRTQFEEELERARAASEARRAEAAAAKAAEVAAQPSAPGRPAVGSIIELPLPRIQITERGPKPPPGRGTIPSTTIPGAGQVRGRFAESQRPGARKQEVQGLGKKKQLPPGKKAKATQITTPAEHKRVIKVDETISVSDLAHQMGVKATEVLKKLWSMGMVGVTINQSIDFETSALLASEFGFEVQSVAFQETAALGAAVDAPEDLVPRAPVVTVMGHVDHGKTSLLDVIRHTDVAAGEAGGITQHIGAYKVTTAAGEVVFLDTPGHAAFTQMRARGAQATDIVILVCAADDGVMPQTVEALNHAKDAKVPIIVAATKCDKPQANPDRVRQQLSEHGLIPEEWGGETIFVNVSAYSKMGIEKLLESIQLQAELLELKANPKKLAKGVVIEAKLDRSRGPMATVLVQEGTLRIGDIVVTGEAMGKVRAMLNDKGSALTEAGPSTPVELLGLDEVPEAGDTVNAVADEKLAKSVVDNRRDQRRKKELGSTGKVSLENILEKIQEGQVKELKIILKTDVQGSAEALKEALGKLSTDKVKVNVIQAGVGGITETDVNLAKAGGAIIIGFHVRPAGKASSLAEQEGVDIKLYDIIYEAIDDVKKAMVGLLAPVTREKPVGKIEVRQVFSIPKIGTVAGCFVTEGKVTRSAQVRLIRDSVQIYTGKLGSLKRFKDDVREVVQGYECGLTIDGYQDVREGDVLEAYEIVEEAPTL